MQQKPRISSGSYGPVKDPRLHLHDEGDDSIKLSLINHVTKEIINVTVFVYLILISTEFTILFLRILLSFSFD